jgi:two-component system chemotaxis sensor kinase CheA
MDIVVSSIRSLGGNVTLNSVPGQGTTFRVRLPLTMAILEGLTIQVGKEVYILPLTSILESIQPRKEDLHELAGRGEIVNLRSESLPIVRLHELFNVPDAITDCAQGLLVIIENDGRKAALLVDELIGQSQVVVKSLESNYGKVEGVAGATILGNGQVGLILDVGTLITGGSHNRGFYARAA